MQKPVKPPSQKYSTLPKFGIAAYIPHPGPGRGTIVRRNERGSGCGGRDSVGHANAGPGRDEPREVLTPCGRTAPVSGEASGRSRIVAYGKTVWSWPSLLRSSFAKMDRGSTGSRAIVNSQGDGDKRELVAGESAHKPSSHRAGKAGCFPAHPFSRCAFACANLRAADHGCQPAPGLPCALFTEEGQGLQQDSGVSCRENADACVLSRMKWCCQTGLNCRPLHYQWSALPLSYGSRCW